MTKNANKTGIFLAILAAALYAVNSPLSKLLLDHIPPTLMAGILYIGAGIGMGIVAAIRKIARKGENGLGNAEKFTKKDLPYTIAMILLDICAPICLLFGLKYTSAETASLLNNFEIVATALIALVIFGEKISPRLWGGIIFITAACSVLSIGNAVSFDFSFGSLFILLAAVCWGIENNCTRRLSSKDPLVIVLLKGIFSGSGSGVIGLVIGERVDDLLSVLAALAVGFVAYGLSIFFYVYAQRSLGAARTSAYYAVAPFIGTAISLAVFRTLPHYTYFIGLALMIVGAVLSARDKPLFSKKAKNIK